MESYSVVILVSKSSTVTFIPFFLASTFLFNGVKCSFNLALVASLRAMPSLTALCLLFVIAEILRPVKANIILALLSVDCLEPNRVKKKNKNKI